MTKFLESIKMIKIFDSATHPTIDNTWLNPRYNDYSNINVLISEMKTYNIYKAFAIGMKNVGGYTLESYIKFLRPFPNLIPIAFCDNANDLIKIKNLGYKGIKIHPRLAKILPDDDKIFEIIQYANQLNLIVIYCGFLGVTEKFIQKIKDERIIFLHSGGKNIENTFEKLKDKRNILLDISYTMVKYPEIADKIEYIFNNYSDRICIGSDHPEVTMKELRDAFVSFSGGIIRENAEKIAYKNIEKFMEGFNN